MYCSSLVVYQSYGDIYLQQYSLFIPLNTFFRSFENNMNLNFLFSNFIFLFQKFYRVYFPLTAEICLGLAICHFFNRLLNQSDFQEIRQPFRRTRTVLPTLDLNLEPEPFIPVPTFRQVTHFFLGSRIFPSVCAFLRRLAGD